MNINLDILDFALIIVYLSLLITIGLFFSLKENNSTEYFLAGKNLGWVAIGSSLFASSISIEHFIGLAGSGATRGLAVGHFEWMACFVIILLGWLFVPLYLNSGVFTLPEFLEKRFNRFSRIYLSSISIIAYVLTKISVVLYAGGILLYEILDWHFVDSAIFMIFIAGIYTIVGGLKAIVHIDMLQTFVMIIGAAVLTILGLHKVGGFSALQSQLPSDFFHMFKPVTDPEFPWTGIVFGAPILAIWYWCTDQYIVQRVLGAKSLQHARSGVIFAGFLKILPVFIFVLPGLIAVVLLNNPDIGDEAFPALLNSNIFPTGVKGLVIASLLAAFISSLANSFNSISTLFTMDIWRNFRPVANEKELVLVGRLATTLLVILSILWVPIMRFVSSQLFIYLTSVQAYIGPPIAAVFILGLISKRVNGKGAVGALAAGAVVGLIRLGGEILYNTGYIHSYYFQKFIHLNFLHFAILLFFISATVMIITSQLSSCPVKSGMAGYSFQLSRLNFSDVFFNQEYKKNFWNTNNIIFSIILVISVTILYIKFF